MKILKYAIGIIALLIIGFFLIGIFNPSIQYSSETIVNKPIKESWDVMNDASKTKLWLTGLKRMELISGEEGQVGTKAKYIMDSNGSEIEMIETIKARTDYERMTLEMDSDILTNNLDMKFTEKDGKTIIKSTNIAQGKGMIMRSMMVLIKSSIIAEDQKIMNNMKRVIEENTTNYSPISAPVVDGEGTAF